MTSRIPQLAAGDRLGASYLNRTADEVNANSDRRPDHAAQVVPGEAEYFYITVITGTVLQGIAGHVAPVGGETVYDIALPPDLAATAWPGGVTVTHIDVNNATATDGVDNETWEMSKAYEVGTIIEATIWETDGRYVDRNGAARMWCKVP